MHPPALPLSSAHENVAPGTVAWKVMDAEVAEVLADGAVSMTVHGLANLLEDLELVPRTPLKGFQLSELDGVN